MITVIPNKKGIIVCDNSHRYRIKPPIWTPRIHGRSIVMGFVGARGSGKSVGAARTIVLDYLMAGYKVWSNMDIGINLLKEDRNVVLQTIPFDKIEIVDLDRVYSHGLIYIDEVNMEMAEARRAMSKENLKFSYILQQLRKRQLNIIWTAQSEMHVDDRLRFQTDIFIKCQDISLGNRKSGIGELSKWECYDYSGVVKGVSPANKQEALYKIATIWNKPWWNAYNTWQLQGIAEPIEKQDTEYDDTVEEIMAMFEVQINDGEEGRIGRRELWRRLGIKDHKTQTMIGIKLSQLGVESRGTNSLKPYYVYNPELAEVT